MIFSYGIVVEGETSTEQSAHELGKLCQNLDNLVVNLIPYNKTNVKDKLSCPSEEHLQLFQKIVSSYGVFCTIRRTMGADIAGACGQLVIEKENEQTKTIDIEDGPFTTHPKIATNKNGSIVQSTKRNKHNDTSDKTTEENKVQNLDRWIKPLTIATGIAGSLFIISTMILIATSKRKR